MFTSFCVKVGKCVEVNTPVQLINGLLIHAFAKNMDCMYLWVVKAEFALSWGPSYHAP